MEAATVVCRSGMLARARHGGRARRHGVDAGAGAGAAARRRLITASLGEPLSAPSPSAVAVAQEVDEDIASTEILAPPDIPGKQVRVKFVLQKRCAFGQQFLVVGDDPALGLWDPAKATALDWSEDHVWTVKRDVPANKLVEFKFLLQDPSGQVHWQPCPNLALQIADTPNTLVVYEDWDRAKNQKVSEEIEPSTGADGVIFSGSNGAKNQKVSEDVGPSTGAEGVIFSGSNGALLADEHQPDENQEINESVATISVDDERSAVAADASLHREKRGANETNQVDQPQLTLDKDERIADELHVRASMLPQNGNPAAIAAADYAGRDGDDTILRDEGAGLEIRSASIFENDMAWARKALQQLLRSLGFQAGTTRT